MKYKPRPPQYHLLWGQQTDNTYVQSSESLANEADAHIRMSKLFESGVKTIVLEKTTIYEVEQ